MITFKYIIQDEDGIHARPAGLLIKEMQKFTSNIKFTKGEKKVDGKKLFAVMSLGAKKGDEITVDIDGEDENAALACAKEFFENNL